MKRLLPALTLLALFFLPSLTAPAADLTITPAGVLPTATSKYEKNGIAGEAFTAGQTLYIKQVTVAGKTVNRLFKAQADGTAQEATVVGVAAASALAAEAPCLYYTTGEVNIGATVTVGTTYYCSATAGGICPVADLVTTNYVTRIGFASAAGVLTLDIKATGVQIP